VILLHILVSPMSTVLLCCAIHVLFNCHLYVLNCKKEDIRANGEQKCDCPPPCSEIWYAPEISNAPFPGNGFNLTRTFKRLVESLNLEPNADATAYFK